MNGGIGSEIGVCTNRTLHLQGEQLEQNVLIMGREVGEMASFSWV